MKKIALLTLPLLVLTSIDAFAADIIAPPSLQTVMQKNEQYSKSISRKIRTPKTNTQSGSTLTGNTNPTTPELILTYRTLMSNPSIHVSRANETDLWVQELDLSAGAHITSSLDLGGYDTTTGEPLFTSKKLSEVVSSQSELPLSIINGQFFDPKKNPTPLSFGLKIDGEVRTAGADNGSAPKNILIIENKNARIVPYSWENLRDATGYFAMVNLSLDKSHYANASIGRTYICLENPDSHNTSSKIAIFTAVSMTETALEKELPRFGCTRGATSKLDSSGSTRLWIGGEYIFGNSHNGVPDYRKIPHSLLIWSK